MRHTSNSLPTHSTQLTLGLALMVSIALSLVITICLFLVSLVILTALIFYNLNSVAQTADTTPFSVIAQGLSGWLRPVTQTNGHQNILLLGIDSLSTRGNAPPLTDTMILVSLNVNSGKVTLLSLPRDIWLENHQSRINTLYAQGQRQNPTHPTELVTQELSTLTGVPIHYTLVISLDTLAELIDVLGGVEITVQDSFSDSRFPRSDVDVTVVKDPALLYETVSFEAGPQVISGERALKFIRSRKSLSREGGDEARTARQQLVIQAVIHRLQSLDPIRDRYLLAQLYDMYSHYFAPYLPVTEAIATAKVILPKITQVSFQGESLTQFPADPKGVLYHPPESTMNGAWVYRVRNQEAFQNEVKDKLQLLETP